MIQHLTCCSICSKCRVLSYKYRTEYKNQSYYCILPNNQLSLVDHMFHECQLESCNVWLLGRRLTVCVRQLTQDRELFLYLIHRTRKYHVISYIEPENIIRSHTQNQKISLDLVHRTRKYYIGSHTQNQKISLDLIHRTRK